MFLAHESHEVFLWVSIIRKFRTEQHRDSILNVRKQALDGAVKFNNDLEKAFLAFDALKKVTKKNQKLSSCLFVHMPGSPDGVWAPIEQSCEETVDKY